MNKKTDEERKAEKEDRERKKTSVKAIDVAIGVTNPVLTVVEKWRGST